MFPIVNGFRRTEEKHVWFFSVHLVKLKTICKVILSVKALRRRNIPPPHHLSASCGASEETNPPRHVVRTLQEKTEQWAMLRRRPAQFRDSNNRTSRSYQSHDELEPERSASEAVQMQFFSDPPGGQGPRQKSQEPGEELCESGRGGSGLLGTRGEDHRCGEAVHTQSRDVDLVTAVSGKLDRETQTPDLFILD